MQFKWHLLIGFTAAYILVQFFGFTLQAGLIIFLSSWLIDIDHYFWYATEAKDKNPINAIKWYMESIPKWFRMTPNERNEFKRGIFVFHGLFFIILLILLSLYYQFFFWVFIGVIIHMVADWINLIYLKEPLYNKIFPTYVMIRNKNKKVLTSL